MVQVWTTTATASNPSHKTITNALWVHSIKQERIIKAIISNEVKLTALDQKLDFIIYYQTKRTADLILKDSPNKWYNPRQKCKHVYQFTYPNEGCHLLHTYIGMTTTKLPRKLTCRLQTDAPKNHMQSDHNMALARNMLVNNTKILESTTDQRRLEISY